MLIRSIIVVNHCKRVNVLHVTGGESHRIIASTLRHISVMSFHRQRVNRLSNKRGGHIFLTETVTRRNSIVLLSRPFANISIGARTGVVDLLERLHTRNGAVLISARGLKSIAAFYSCAIVIGNAILTDKPASAAFATRGLRLTFDNMLHRIALGNSRRDVVASSRHPFITRQPSTIRERRE